jgi:class 3 adenylate cyclase/predicted ATPase
MTAADPTPLSFEGFTLDPAARTLVDAGGGQISLRRSEFDLLLAFVNAPGRALSRDYLLEAVAGRHLEAFDRSIDVLVGRLRRKIEPEPSQPRLILTVPGIGYRFAAKPRRVSLQPEPEIKTGLPILAQRLSEAPERRQLTVVFCDLVGSTALSTRVDPEDLREVISAYYRCVADTVARFGGFVAKYMGDGVLIYFGYPEAHEDDAERAVRAGLAVIDAIDRLSAPQRLDVRLGVASGLVVVGDLIGAGAAEERGVIGEAPNLAARLQTLAQPGMLVIADSTRRQTGSLFEIEDLGPQPLAGFAEPQRAWRVVGESGVLSRFEALRSVAAPLIGRDEELDLLLRRWQQAKAGEGRVVLVSGEPGIGKSRLCAALLQRTENEPHTRLRYFCSPYHQDSAFYPFIVQLDHAAGFARDDPRSAKLEKLKALAASAAPPDEDVALLADLLSLPASEHHPLPNLSPQRKKQRTLEALLRQLESLARRQPVVMVFEDAHWSDATSRELLDLTVEWVRRLPVLLIVTFRPEFQPPWTAQPQVSTVVLSRLDRGDRTALITHIASGKALPEEVINQIADRTDGVPLFIEELTKSTLESGLLRETADRYVLDRALAPLAIPTTLHASLLARLDRLASMRYVAQIGAAIGREFSYELLRTISDLGEGELQAALARLVASELVFQRGTPPDSVYSFKHALVQDAAHESLLRSARQQLHAQIAQALEAHFPELVEMQPELLAQHYTEAGLFQKAVAYWCRAGQQSSAKSAFIEAIEQLRRGLRLISDLPGGADRKRQELDLQLALANALRGVRGYGDPEVADAFGRALNLVRETDAAGTFLHFAVLYGMAATNWSGGRPQLALERANEFFELARSRPESGMSAVGHRWVGTVQITLGDHAAALPHLERAVASYSPDAHRGLAARFGADIGVNAYLNLASALWHRGYPDQASKAAAEGLRLARQSPHFPTLAYALFMAGLTPSSLQHAAESEALANELVVISRQHGFEVFLGWGLILQGAAMAHNGQRLSSVGRIREGLAMAESTGSLLYEPIFQGLLAEALALAGDVKQGLVVLTDALAMAEASGARGNNAELRRLQGNLLQRSVPPDWTEAEARFRQALAIALQQGTRGLELRAAVSLARLLKDQGRRDEARDLLVPICDWFSEGFDTPDLKEAKALLRAL